MKPLDISERAEEVYFQRLRELELARLNMWVALGRVRTACSGPVSNISFRDATEEEIRFEIPVRRLGVELAQRVYKRP